ncbi:hypothetical protein GCM10023321_50030 [Pseudonocardia eucalypti]|uniref:HTH marR-type domain-containing protein n=1 Tax=Pseudonocardia eucalypti TaxID=648755 RepID=A0ABP9QK66_9PSEU
MGHLLQVRIDQALSAEGITARQFDALEHIAADSGLHRASLARILHTSPQAAAGLTRRLHDRGLLERHFLDPWSPITFAITEAGTRCLARARPIVTAVEREVLSHLPERLVAVLSDGVLGLVHGVDWLSDPQGLVDEVYAAMTRHPSRMPK